MDGWAVLSALKADPDVADIPVIMLTIVDDKNLGYALGAADYLTKPIDRERLVTVLKQAPARPPGAGRGRRRRRSGSCSGACSSRRARRSSRPRMAGWRSSACGEVPPSLILLDLMMPEMDGFEFVAEFRRHEAWRTIPVVVITAKDLTREDHERLNGYVQKILQKGAHGRDQLLAEVRELVATSVARRRAKA